MSVKKLTLKKIFTQEPVGEIVLAQGWIRSVRNSKEFSFVVINDGTTQNNLQVIVNNNLENYEDISKLLTGACVGITGKLVASQGKGQSVELHAEKAVIYGGVPEDYPLQKKGTTLEFLRDIPHLRPRTNTFGAVFRIRHQLAQATHRFFSGEGYYYLNSPLITANDGEGAGEMFNVTTLNISKPDLLPKTKEGKTDFAKDFFGAPVNLTVTGQLEGEAFAMALGGIYTFGPTFRAENSNTPRHLSEFWMVEPEVAFFDLEDTADLATRYLKHMIGEVLNNCRDDLEFLQKFYKKDLIETLEHVHQAEFKRITYTEAIDILQKAKEAGEQFQFPCDWGSDLQTEHERFLTEKHFNLPVIVTDYPKSFKAFYMKQNADGKTVRAMDILVPGVGEIIGGSQREDDYQKLISAMKEKNIPEEGLEWYLNLRRFGSAPHSGFGLGFERAVMYMTGMTNIRDVIPFPRTPNNCK